MSQIPIIIVTAASVADVIRSLHAADDRETAAAPGEAPVSCDLSARYVGLQAEDAQLLDSRDFYDVARDNYDAIKPTAQKVTPAEVSNLENPPKPTGFEGWSDCEIGSQVELFDAQRAGHSPPRLIVTMANMHGLLAECDRRGLSRRHARRQP